MTWGTILLAIFFTTGIYLAVPYFVVGTSSTDVFVRQLVPYFCLSILGIILVLGWLGKHE